VFAIAVLLFWTSTGLFIEAPWTWGTSSSLGKLAGWRSYFAYPFVLLWALPLGASLIAHSTAKSGNIKGATAVAMTPLMIFSLTMAIYHIAPLEWR
jgi:hypothetical protein